MEGRGIYWTANLMFSGKLGVPHRDIYKSESEVYYMLWAKYKFKYKLFSMILSR